MQREGIPLSENKELRTYLQRIATQNETGTSTGTFYLNREQYEISKEIRMMSASHGGHLANELHMTEYAAAVDMQKANTQMISELLHLDPEDARVIYTSGGTFSIFQAMAVYVKQLRDKGV